MSASVLGLLVLSAALAAVGQVLFKLGAEGRVAMADFVNLWIVTGLLAYGIGTVIWIYALSRAPLTMAYPFTALTFALVYLAGVTLLGEQTTSKALVGIALVLIGLLFISDS